MGSVLAEMTESLARYSIGLAIGIALGAIGTWKMAHDSADRVLSDWERAVEAQRAAEKKRTDAINRETIHGLTNAYASLRARMDAGWRPTIPAASSVSPGGVSQTPAGTDETATAELPAPAGNEARLIEDGQATVLQCQALQEWVEKVSNFKSDHTQ